MPDIFEYINLGKQSKSKKDGIVNGILAAITANAISKGDRLPSVNKLIQRLGVARMTIVKSLNTLKERGIIEAENKVGYYVKDADVKRELKVFLFLTGFNSYHEILYNSIIDEVNNHEIAIDLFFHHCNPKIFKSVLYENLDSYGLFVITGFDDPHVKTMLSHIPPKKLLQIIRPPLLGGVSFICQDFYLGLKKSLEKLTDRLAKYDRFILVQQEKKGHPKEISLAFTEYCTEQGIAFQTETKVIRDIVVKGSAFWVIEDSDLILLIKIGEEMGLQIGKDLGILSYNETPMKEIIRKGISVISANFEEMGRSVARFITHPKYTVEVFPPEVIIRESV